MNRNLSGAYSGFIATGPMTMFMLGAHRQLPKKEKSPLPPATLSLETVERVTGAEHVPEVAQSLLTMSSHFAYGAAAGVLYSQTFARLKMKPVPKGILFGLSFWGANYLGISPAFQFRADGTEMPARRNAMMILAHVVWGASLAYCEEILRESGKEILEGEHQAPAAE